MCKTKNKILRMVHICIMMCTYTWILQKGKSTTVFLLSWGFSTLLCNSSNVYTVMPCGNYDHWSHLIGLIELSLCVIRNAWKLNWTNLIEYQSNGIRICRSSSVIFVFGLSNIYFINHMTSVKMQDILNIWSRWTRWAILFVRSGYYFFFTLT